MLFCVCGCICWVLFVLCLHLFVIPLCCSAVCRWQFGHGVLVGLVKMSWHVPHLCGLCVPFVSLCFLLLHGLWQFWQCVGFSFSAVGLVVRHVHVVGCV